MVKLPWGVLLLKKIFHYDTIKKHYILNKISVFLITYVSYVMYHASRKSLAVAKSSLDSSSGNSTGNTTFYGGWAPFNGPHSLTYFSIMDSIWSIFYSLTMFGSGHAAEYFSLNLFLSLGLALVGFVSILFGCAKYFMIHHISYFIIIQIFSGAFNSFGWPCIIAIMANWFSENKHGAIFGIWTSHMYVGNILGQVIASYFLSIDWALSFIVPGIMCIVISIFVYLFLIPDPKDIGFNKILHQNERLSNNINLSSPILENEKEDSSSTHRDFINDDSDLCQVEKPMNFFRALMLPGVLEYSFSLFFGKLVSYTFLFWLPKYIKEVGINNYVVTATSAGYLATFFDVGAAIGGLIVGLIADLLMKNGITCSIFQLLSAINLLLYAYFGSYSLSLSIAFLFFGGFLVCGPITLISTSISANLGSIPELKKVKAKATVAAIIDGIGSLGAASGPLVVYFSSKYNWETVMISMTVSLILSSLLLSRQTFKEIKKIFK